MGVWVVPSVWGGGICLGGILVWMRGFVGRPIMLLGAVSVLGAFCRVGLVLRWPLMAV
jgi:hypothetical protein